MKAILAFTILLSMNAFALTCDCEVRVSPPTTASHQMEWTPLKRYTLETYDTYKVKNQVRCRNMCQRVFEDDLPNDRMTALLMLHSARMIKEGVVGYNCTGLTTLKYPVRVKATMGKLNLGNVIDQMYVVNHEEQCF